MKEYYYYMAWKVGKVTFHTSCVTTLNPNMFIKTCILRDELFIKQFDNEQELAQYFTAKNKNNTP